MNLLHFFAALHLSTGEGLSLKGSFPFWSPSQKNAKGGRRKEEEEEEEVYSFLFECTTVGERYLPKRCDMEEKSGFEEHSPLATEGFFWQDNMTTVGKLFCPRNAAG